MLIVVDVADFLEDRSLLVTAEVYSILLDRAEKKAGKLVDKAHCDAVVVWGGLVRSVVQHTVNELCGWVATRLEMQPQA
jgi:hypothetical protein